MVATPTDPGPAAAGERRRSTGGAGRLLFVDNIRIYLTILVMLHHLMITYAGSGGWYYREGRQDDLTSILGGYFCAVNQAYFMGLFLLISAYFVPGSYDRKGPRRFLVDRLIRLGIPLAVFSWIVRPLWIYWDLTSRQGLRISFWKEFIGPHFSQGGFVGGGPLWFIEALLLFSVVYLLVRLASRRRPTRPVADAPFPGNGAIALFAVLLGLAAFLVRLVSPVNDTFRPLNFQFANFCQYIALFVVGLVAYRRNWLHTLPIAAGRLWLWAAVAVVLLYGPLGVLAGALESQEPFLGGWHWQALLFAEWDAFACVSICLGLCYAFRRFADRQGRLAAELGRSAYAAYLIHEPLLVALALAAAPIDLHPLLKFVLASLVAVPLCFALSSLVRRLPGARRVL